MQSNKRLEASQGSTGHPLCPGDNVLEGLTFLSHMPKPTLYVKRLLPDPVMVELSDRFTLTRPPSSESPTRRTILKGVRDADALIPTLAEQIDTELMADAPRLRVIANYAVGYNNIDVAAAQARGIVVTNTPDILLKVRPI